MRCGRARGERAAEPVEPYKICCPAQCGAHIELKTKPLKLNRGWPMVTCKQCGACRRVGGATCAKCSLAVRACFCGDRSCGGTGPGTGNGDIRSFFQLA
eukprot:8097661-Alexandrium_andersonii.AAC.1